MNAKGEQANMAIKYVIEEIFHQLYLYNWMVDVAIRIMKENH